MTTATISRVGLDLAIPRDAEGFDMPAIARRMWLPMLAMGLMATAAGVVTGIVQATLNQPLHVAQVAAWNAGLLFLGVGLLLGSVTFLLATILGELRDGGTSVQQALGEKALILKRPLSGKLFPPVMMMGLMTLLVALAVGFVEAARLDTNPSSAADIASWVGPLRFAGVALLFTGVSLALATIVRALRFQASRIRQIADERAA